jgi:hypothetical protein
MVKPKQNYSAETQPEKDKWETPAVAYEGIRWWLGTPGDFYLWESAYGTGRSTEHLQRLDYNVLSGGSNTDFFETTPGNYGRHYSRAGVIQVTNPPYSKKYEWLERSYELGIPFALLLPTDTLAAGKGMRLFAKYGVTVVIPERRIGFVHPETGITEENATMSTAWFLWAAGDDSLVDRLEQRCDGQAEKIGMITLPAFQYGSRLKQATDIDYFDFVSQTPPTQPSWF